MKRILVVDDNTEYLQVLSSVLSGDFDTIKATGVKIKSVQVHHITYKNLGNENVLTDICTLCGSCYKKTHNYYNCKRA